METEPHGEASERRDSQKRQWARDGNRSRLGARPPDLAIRPPPVDPISGEEPVGERRHDAGADDDEQEAHGGITHLLSYGTPMKFAAWSARSTAVVSISRTVYRPLSRLIVIGCCQRTCQS